MKKLISILTVALLSGCAGLSEVDKAEKEALSNYQKADAKVVRKETKLALATAASTAAAANVLVSAGELAEAKKSKEVAYQELIGKLEEGKGGK